LSYPELCTHLGIVFEAKKKELSLMAAEHMIEGREIAIAFCEQEIVELKASCSSRAVRLCKEMGMERAIDLFMTEAFFTNSFDWNTRTYINQGVAEKKRAHTHQKTVLAAQQKALIDPIRTDLLRDLVDKRVNFLRPIVPTEHTPAHHFLHSGHPNRATRGINLPNATNSYQNPNSSHPMNNQNSSHSMHNQNLPNAPQTKASVACVSEVFVIILSAA
jgi:hypothetical protein